VANSPLERGIRGPFSVTARFSYGVLWTMVVRVETLAAERMRASRSSRAWGVSTRTLRM
jgi:hypothetical protein